MHLVPEDESGIHEDWKGIVWRDENDDPIEDMGEYLITKEQQRRQECLQKYTPIGSVVKVKDKLCLHMIVGYQSCCDDVVYDYLAVKYPDGMTDHAQMSTFNHEDICEFHHFGMDCPMRKAYNEQLLSGKDR